MAQMRRRNIESEEFENRQENLMPEAFMPGHEVVCWEDGQPVRGYIEGVEVNYRNHPRESGK